MATGDTQKRGDQGSGVDASLQRHGGLSYLEIPAADVRQSAVFYERVLDWKVSGAETDHPKFSDATGQLIGRWVTGRAVSREPGLMPYFYVIDVKETVSRATELGGQVIKPRYREGNLWIATFRDPAGNLIGVWQAAEA